MPGDLGDSVRDGNHVNQLSGKVFSSRTFVGPAKSGKPEFIKGKGIFGNRWYMYVLMYEALINIKIMTPEKPEFGFRARISGKCPNS